MARLTPAAGYEDCDGHREKRSKKDDDDDDPDKRLQSLKARTNFIFNPLDRPPDCPCTCGPRRLSSFVTLHRWISDQDPGFDRPLQEIITEVGTTFMHRCQCVECGPWCSYSTTGPGRLGCFNNIPRRRWEDGHRRCSACTIGCDTAPAVVLQENKKARKRDEDDDGGGGSGGRFVLMGNSEPSVVLTPRT